MRVICTGSRHLDDEAGRLVVDHVLDDLFTVAEGRLYILVGDCPTGADYWVRNWATYRRRQGWDVECEEFAAHWRTTSPRAKAGPDRNKRMVDAGADLAVGFFAPLPENKGTAGCLKLARAAKIPVREYGRENQATTDYEQETLPI